MSKQSLLQSRRQFLKGAAYASALSLTGVAGLTKLAIADGNAATQSQMIGGEIINLINHTASVVSFDGQTIAAGEQRSVVTAPRGGLNNGRANKKNVFISDVLTDDQLVIRSDYSEFNGVFLVAEFGMIAA